MNSGICSVVTAMSGGTNVEVMIVVVKAMAGLPALESAEATTATYAFMQVPGGAIKTRAHVIREEFRRQEKLQSLLLRHMQLKSHHHRMLRLMEESIRILFDRIPAV